MKRMRIETIINKKNNMNWPSYRWGFLLALIFLLTTLVLILSTSTSAAAKQPKPQNADSIELKQHSDSNPFQQVAIHSNQNEIQGQPLPLVENKLAVFKERHELPPQADRLWSTSVFSAHHAHVVLVQLGSWFPYHIYDCVNQLYLFSCLDDPNRVTVTLIYDSDEVEHYARDIPHLHLYRWKDPGGTSVAIDAVSKPHGELFYYSQVRFRAIRDWMVNQQIQRVIHMEHDNMIYMDIADLASQLHDQYGSKLALTRDSPHRCIAGFMYIGSHSALTQYLEFLQHRNSVDPNELDMFTLSQFLIEYPNMADTLPVIMPGYHTETDQLNMSYHKDWSDEPIQHWLFDAAALGQYVGGIDTLHDRNDTRGFINETAIYSAADLHIFWVPDEEDRVVPVIEYEQQYYRLVNLHVHSKKLHEFVSQARVHPKDIIQGNRFHEWCDAIFDHQSDWVAELEKLIAREYDSDSEEVDATYPTLFVKTDLWPRFVQEIWSAPMCPSAFIVVSHNADHCITEEHLPYLNDDRIIKWFAQNVQVAHPKLMALPIGLANSEWAHGQVDLLQQASRHTSPLKTVSSSLDAGSAMYCNFSMTHPHRVYLAEHVLNNKQEQLDFSTYLHRLSSYEQIACPRGNGPDTHRLWETLYMGRIPVTFDHIAECTQWHTPFLESNWIPRVLHGSGTKSEVGLLGRAYLRVSYYQAFWRRWRKRVAEPDRFDMVMTIHPKDADMVPLALFRVQKYLVGLDKIYIVTKRDSIHIEKTNHRIQLVDETDSSIFPFQRSDIESIITCFGRVGWYYQQLLKLYSYRIHGIRKSFLLFDGDNIVLRPLNKNQLGHFVRANHEPYLKYCQRVLSDMQVPFRYPELSGVVHMMLLDGRRVHEMLQKIDAKGDNAWQMLLQHVDPKDYPNSGMSEYDLYFHWMTTLHSHEFPLTKLRQKDGNATECMQYVSSRDHHYVSCHAYIRNIHPDDDQIHTLLDIPS